MIESREAAWERCRGWIEGALEYAGGTHTIADVEDEIAAGEAWFWPGEKAAIVTQLHIYPRLKAMSYWLAGGDLDELLSMTVSIEAYAKAIGCQKIFESGRPGWSRALKSLGYTPLHVVVWKDLR